MNKAKYWIGSILAIVAFFASSSLVITITGNLVVNVMIQSIVQVTMFIVFLLAFGLKD